MTSPRFSVQKFNDLARHFRLGDAVIQLAEMILDGRSLPLSWQGQHIVQDVGNAYVRIVGSIEQPSPLDLVPGDFFANPTRFKELRAIADMRLPICVGDGWIVKKDSPTPELAQFTLVSTPAKTAPSRRAMVMGLV